MTQNLLTQRLKAAKRELTNLKTAHKRGRGLLKLYSYEGQATPADSTKIYDITITVTFSNKFAKNPFVVFLRDTVDPNAQWMGSALRTDMQYYSDDGYKLILKGNYYDWHGGDNEKYKVIATSPITNVNIDWVENA